MEKNPDTILTNKIRHSKQYDAQWLQQILFPVGKNTKQTKTPSSPTNERTHFISII